MAEVLTIPPTANISFATRGSNAWDFQQGSYDMTQNHSFVSHTENPRISRPLSRGANERPDERSADTTSNSLPSSLRIEFAPAFDRPSSRESGSEPLEFDDLKDSGPPRPRSVSSGKSDKEKRKRSRVTPEQLVHLERFFAIDRSPTAARRREISEMLGMHERQTQIWFQNRRAKAKLQDGRQKGRGGSAEMPPDSPPELSTGFQVDLHNLIHEDEPVTIIPCTDLTIGTWRRIATAVGKHDLVAYVCESRRCLTWFIHSAGYGFKMEIPFDTIVDTEFTNAAPGSGLASFMLSAPPLFYLEALSSPQADGATIRSWKRCSDWTEGHQASRVLRHDLVGSAVQLAHLLRDLHATTAGQGIALHPPTYRSGAVTPQLELPPSVSGLRGADHRHHSDVGRHSLALNGINALSRRSSYQPSSNFALGSVDATYAPPRSAPHTSSFSYQQSYPPIGNQDTTGAPAFQTPLSTEFGPQVQQILGGPQAAHLMGTYAGIPISHGVASRPSLVHRARTFYDDTSRVLEAVNTDEVRLRRIHSTADIRHAYEHPTSSPPLLTTAYHPPPHLLQDISAHRVEHMHSTTPPVDCDCNVPVVPLYESSDSHNRSRDKPEE